jgi:hypothetical protein
MPAACVSGNLSIPHIREESMFRMLVRRVKRKIFGSQREEMTGDWKNTIMKIFMTFTLYQTIFRWSS